jgi:hypothetical protein
MFPGIVVDPDEPAFISLDKTSEILIGRNNTGQSDEGLLISSRVPFSHERIPDSGIAAFRDAVPKLSIQQRAEKYFRDWKCLQIRLAYGAERGGDSLFKHPLAPGLAAFAFESFAFPPAM